MIRCQACGTENPPGTTYCSHCANRLDEETQQSIAQRRADHAATGVRWSAVVVAVLMLILLIAVIALLVTHVR